MQVSGRCSDALWRSSIITVGSKSEYSCEGGVQPHGLQGKDHSYKEALRGIKGTPERAAWKRHQQEGVVWEVWHLEEAASQRPRAHEELLRRNQEKSDQDKVHLRVSCHFQSCAWPSPISL